MATTKTILIDKRDVFNYESVQISDAHLPELNWEPGVIPGRARRCNRGRKLHYVTVCKNRWEGAAK